MSSRRDPLNKITFKSGYATLICHEIPSLRMHAPIEIEIIKAYQQFYSRRKGVVADSPVLDISRYYSMH